MKTLREIAGKTFNPNIKFEPRVPKEREFFYKNISTKPFPNLYSGKEYDAMFKGDNVKQSARESERHGYSLGNDAKVYEELSEADLSPEVEKMMRDAAKKLKRPPGFDREKVKARDEKDHRERIVHAKNMDRGYDTLKKKLAAEHIARKNRKNK